MFTYACRGDTRALSTNPVSGTDKRREDPPAALDYYEVEEVEALARCCEQGQHRGGVPSTDPAEIAARRLEDRRYAEGFRLLFFTGLRLGEVLTLRREDVDLQDRLLLVRRGLSSGQETLPKGRRHRFVALPTPAVATLARLADRDDFTGADDYGLANRLGRRLDPSALRRRCRGRLAAGAATRPAARRREPDRPHLGRRLRACLPRAREARYDGPMSQREASPGGAKAPRRRVRPGRRRACSVDLRLKRNRRCRARGSGDSSQ
ncbi:MAG: tyrosine-type recombinase/integrase [Actinomycetota bacterium]|nr:tyrosine-type recombinase/integrase [Actinomycetota bacterium]